MTKEAWISAKKAAEIISANSGRPIIQQYVRELAQKGKIASRPVDGRTNEYLRSDVEKVKVRIKKVADRQKTQQEQQTSGATTTVSSPSEQKTIAEERPWYLPEQEKSTEEKSEDAA